MALALSLLATPAATLARVVEADWGHWQRLLEVRPAEALRTVSAIDMREWSAAEQLRANLLRAHALVELGRGNDARERLEGLAGAVQRSGTEIGLRALWEVLYGVALRDRANDATSREHIARGLALAQQAADVPLQSYARLHLTASAIFARDFREAASQLEADSQLVRSAGSAHVQARHLYWQGNLQMELADFKRASQSFAAAAERFRSGGNPTWESDCERLMAEVAILADQPTLALQPARRATELLQTLDDPVYLAYARSALAVALAAHGRHDEARQQLAQAMTVAARFPASTAMATVHLHRARVLLLAGEAAAAELALRADIGPLMARDGQRQDRQRRYQQLLAETLSALGRSREAEAAWREVIRIERQSFERSLEGQLEAQRGALEAQRLQRENDLLQSRAQAAEQALQAETSLRLVAAAGGAVVLAGALGGLWWLRRVNHRIAAVAASDALTGLLNRRSALTLAAQSLAALRTQGQPLAVVMFDLDHFKDVNDTWGHAAGDEALRQVADRLRDGLRRSDHLARWGGEEFLLLLPGTRLAEALALAERQRDAVARAGFRLPGQALPLALTVSVGVATADARDADAAAAIERADRALYLAKQRGRNRVVGPDLDPAPAGADEAADGGAAFNA